MNALPVAVALAALSDGVRFVVCDLETTPSDTGDRVVSAGIVQVDGRGRRRAPDIEWLCDPGCKIENTRFHGITDADVAGKPPFSAHLDELATLLSPRPGETEVVLVAHNARFDLGVLQLEHARAGRTLTDFAVLDTLKLARYLKIAAAGFRLTDLLAHYGHRPTNAHNALADASDTAFLLQQLLEQAARGGADDLATLLAAVQGKLLRSGDHAARAAARRETRARRDSTFTAIARPDSHRATHTRLPPNPTPAQLEAWRHGLHECIELRCPALMDRVGTVRSGNRAVLDILLDELDELVIFGTDPNVDATVSVNATLGALGEAVRKHLPMRDVPGVYDRIAATITSTVVRCGAGALVRPPYDACPECRIGNACPADTWWQPFAVALTGHGINPARMRVWLGENGRIAEHAAAGRKPLAAHAAWLLINAADRTQPENANAVAVLAEQFGLVEPRLLLRNARELAGAGELEQAIDAANAALAACNGSTDVAWRELRSYRDALTARRHALQRVRPPRPYRAGLSAPDERPQRRRFTLGGAVGT